MSDDAEFSDVAASPVVKVEFHSSTEHLVASVDHALVIVPDLEGQHRAYFRTQSMEQLGQMVATAIALALENGDGRAMAVAIGILQGAEPGAFRGVPRR